jgi:hypothetical protein
MSDEPQADRRRWEWELLWRGCAPQLIMLAFIVLATALLIWLEIEGYYPVQSARE